MDYQVGQTGRVVVARLFEGEDVHACIEEIARKEGIRAATVLLTGGIRKGDLVIGPSQEQPKIIPDSRPFQGPGEVVGVGTLYWDDQGPKLHLHVGLSQESGGRIGCLRGEVSTFLILEVTLIEVTGIEATRRLDEATGFKLLDLSQKD